MGVFKPQLPPHTSHALLHYLILILLVLTLLPFNLFLLQFIPLPWNENVCSLVLCIRKKRVALFCFSQVFQLNDALEVHKRLWTSEVGLKAFCIVRTLPWPLVFCIVRTLPSSLVVCIVTTVAIAIASSRAGAKCYGLNLKCPNIKSCFDFLVSSP